MNGLVWFSVWMALSAVSAIVALFGFVSLVPSVPGDLQQASAAMVVIGGYLAVMFCCVARTALKPYRVLTGDDVQGILFFTLFGCLGLGAAIMGTWTDWRGFMCAVMALLSVLFLCIPFGCINWKTAEGEKDYAAGRRLQSAFADLPVEPLSPEQLAPPPPPGYDTQLPPRLLARRGQRP